jgi:hypothetical protein
VVGRLVGRQRITGTADRDRVRGVYRVRRRRALQGRPLRVSDLPLPRPYLRAKYPDLPPEAVEQAERYLTRLMRQHGVVADGPAPGEDET